MIGSAALKRENSLNKVQKAIKEHNGSTLMFVAEQLDILKAYVETGVRLLEFNGGSIYKERDATITGERNETPLEERAEIMKVMRQIVGDDMFVTMQGYGTFTNLKLVSSTDKDALALSMAGLDGCHTHLWVWEDLKELVEIAHRNGLLVDAYISHSKDKYYYYGITADTPEEVSEVTKKMEDIGVDMVGIMSGMTYMGLKSGKLTPDMRGKINALVETAKVPTLVEGGINLSNFQEFKETGVNVVIVHTALKEYIHKTIVDFINNLNK